MIQQLALRLLGLLIGLTLIGCSKQLVVKKWYEPAVTAPNQNDAGARMLREQRVVDDADYCLQLLKLSGSVSPRDTFTVYLPYDKWRTITKGDTVRLSPRRYSDWNIKTGPR